MMLYAWAPSQHPAPLLWCRYSWVKGLGLRWDDVGGIGGDEIATLAQLTTIYDEAQRVKAQAARRIR